MSAEQGTSVAGTAAMPPLVWPREICGPWVIHAADDGPQASTRGQVLMLFDVGTYVWSPAPEWARSGGVWGVTSDDAGDIRLHFEQADGSLVGHFLVITQFEPGEPFCLHWQRSCSHAVVFTDRMFRADRPATWSAHPLPERDVT